MAYTDGEALILTVVRGHANFDSDNSARSKWNLLNSGKSDHYAIITPSVETVEPVFITPTKYVVPWLTKVEVWQRYKDDGSSQSNLYGYVQNVISQVQKTKTLSDTTNTIQNAEVVGISQPLEMWTESGGPAWIKQEVLVEWHEETSVTFV